MRKGNEAATTAGRKRFARAVLDALAAKGESVNATARRMGIGAATLRSWLQRDGEGVDPDPRKLAALAAATDIDHMSLLALIGYAPERLLAPGYRMHVARQVSDLGERLGTLATELRSMMEIATQDTEATGTARILAAIVARSDSWQVRTRPRVRGSRFPIRAADHVAFLPAGGERTASTGKPSFETNDETRVELEARIGDVIVQSAAAWRDSRLEKPPKVERAWFGPPNLILTVPRLLAPRFPTSDRGTTDSSIACIGVPYSGASEVGALIADQLGWGSWPLGTLALTYRSALPRAAGPPVRLTERAHIREPFGALGVATTTEGASAPTPKSVQEALARQLLRDPGDGGANQLVWSVIHPEVIDFVTRKVGQNPPIILFLSISQDDLLIHAEKQLGHLGYSVEGLRETQDLIRARLKRLSDEGESWQEIKLGEVSLKRRLLEADENRIFDAHVEAALQASKWLSERFEGLPDRMGTPVLSRFRGTG